jgi:hypothetical protein
MLEHYVFPRRWAFALSSFASGRDWVNVAAHAVDV